MIATSDQPIDKDHLVCWTDTGVDFLRNNSNQEHFFLIFIYIRMSSYDFKWFCLYPSVTVACCIQGKMLFLFFHGFICSLSIPD